MAVRVDAYRNLNDDCISLRSREPDTRGRVIDHVDTAVIRDVEFIVQPAGRRRVLDEERKNVHAFVRGYTTDRPRHAASGIRVTYNPYKYASFVTVDNERPVVSADVAVVTTEGVTAYGVGFA
jgi:hypothetical protein